MDKLCSLPTISLFQEPKKEFIPWQKEPKKEFFPWQKEPKNSPITWYIQKLKKSFLASQTAAIESSLDISYQQELNNETIARQKAGIFMQHIGEKLKLSQATISVGTVMALRFMQAFSFKDVDIKKVSTTAIFLAAKTHNNFRRLEQVIKTAYNYLNPRNPHIDVKSEGYLQLKEEFHVLEEAILQVLGFNVCEELPHPYVVKICQLIEGSKKLSVRAYHLATISILATTMCLQHKPTIVACVCINLAARWSNLKMNEVSGGHPWFYYADSSLTEEVLIELTDELEKIITRGSIGPVNSLVYSLVLSDISNERSSTNAEATKTENSRNNPQTSILALSSSNHSAVPERCRFEAKATRTNYASIIVPTVFPLVSASDYEQMTQRCRRDVKEIMVKIPLNLVSLK